MFGAAAVARTNLPELAAALLERARADLRAGVHEDLGPNDGTRIREYLATFGFEPPAPWCAASVGTWLHEASNASGVATPVAGSASAIETGKQFERAGRWVPIAEASKAVLVPGNVLVWTRGDTRACAINLCPLGCKGHIGVIERYDGGAQILTIEGNSGPHGDRVANMTRALDDERLLGVGVLREGAASPRRERGAPSRAPLVLAAVGGFAAGWLLVGYARRMA